MKFYMISATLLLAGAPHALAIPTNATLSARGSACGTAGDAVASDCEQLFNSNFSINYGHTCKYLGIYSDELVIEKYTAYKLVCSPGNCCIYTTHKGLSVDQARKYGREALGNCRSIKKNTINGRVATPKGQLCISDRKGCIDCLTNPPAPNTYMPTSMSHPCPL
ncbi:hypothetical protein BD779DRAFT_319188 [Infundibulicybe gibba]|nr:hypothetical protein BD779DRAFT_319188 [Infundibulicybe gibba]